MAGSRPGVAAHVVDRRRATEAHLGVLARQSFDQEREDRGLEADVPEEIRECVCRATDLRSEGVAAPRGRSIRVPCDTRSGLWPRLERTDSASSSRHATSRGGGASSRPLAAMVPVISPPGAECGRRIVEQGRQRLLGDRCFPGKTRTQVADDDSRRIPDHLRFVLHGPNEMGKHLREFGPRQLMAEDDGLHPPCFVALFDLPDDDPDRFPGSILRPTSLPRPRAIRTMRPWFHPAAVIGRYRCR